MALSSQLSSLLLLSLILFSVSHVHSDGKSEEDEDELEKEICALDQFIQTQMRVKQPSPVMTNGSGFPDFNAFQQLYETGADRAQSGGICSACNVGLGLIMHMIRENNAQLSDLEDVTIFVCRLFKLATPEVCSGIIERYAPTFYFIFKERPRLTSKAFCGVMLQSLGCTSYDPYLEWTVEVPTRYTSKLKEVNDERKHLTCLHPESQTLRSTRIKIIQLTDIHVDPLYEAGAGAVCDNKILCCQGSQGRPLNKSLQAGYFGDPRKCDTPFQTLHLALEQMAQEHSDAELFYMTGDLVPHNLWSTTRADNTKVIQRTVAAILKYFPRATVIPLLGNHETHPVNFFSPLGVPEHLSTRWIYNTSFDAFKQWIPPNQADLYRKAGYFTFDVSPKFRVIVLNSNFCYGFNVWQTYEIGDTDGHLAWLIAQLQLAESEKKTVHIIGHVPPGHNECSRVWSRNYYQVMLRYHQIIKGQFYGHTHYAELKVLYNEEHEPINVLWIAPSLTPYEVHNMAYRVYYADPTDYQIMDYETWIFDLKEANRNPEGKPEWFKWYTGAATYGIPDVRPKSLGLWLDRMAVEDHEFQLFYQHYHKIIEVENRKQCNVHCKKRILCAIVRSYQGEEENCARIQLMIDGIILPVQNLL